MKTNTFNEVLGTVLEFISENLFGILFFYVVIATLVMSFIFHKELRLGKRLRIYWKKFLKWFQKSTPPTEHELLQKRWDKNAKIFKILSVGSIVLATFLSFVFWGTHTVVNIGGLSMEIMLGQIATATLLIYIIASIRKIDGNDIGVRLALGNIIDEVHSGLRFVPRFIAKVEIYPAGAISMTVKTPPDITAGTRPHKVVITREGSGAEVSYNDAFRVNTKGDAEEARRQNDPLLGPLTIDPRIIARGEIHDARWFYYSAENLEGLVAILLNDLVACAQSEFASADNARQILNELEQIGVKIRSRAGRLIGDPDTMSGLSLEEQHEVQIFGFDLTMVTVSDMGIPQRISVAMADAGKSTAERAVRLNEADTAAYEKRTVGTAEADALKARGLAQAAVDQASGEAEAAVLKAKQKVADTPGGQLLLVTEAATEAAKALAEGKATVIVANPGDPAGIVAMLATVNAMQKKPDPAQPTT